MKKILSEKGMTLVEVLIAAGISAGVALVGAQLMGEFYSNQNYLEVQAEIQREANAVQKLLSDKAACNRNFNQFPTTQSFTTPVSTTLYPANGTSAQFFPRSYGKYNLSNITISQNPTNQNLKNVNLIFSWPNKKFVKNHAIEKTVSVFVTQNTSNEWSCNEVVEENSLLMKQELCNSLDDGEGVFTKWENGKCELLQFRCEPGEVPTRLSSLGRFICAPIKTVLPPNTLIDTAPVDCPQTADNISITWNGSKYELTCTGGGTLTPPPPPPPGSCSSACDCPNSYDACIAGACVTQSSMGACTHGTVVKGDNICQWRCSGGGWTCPYPPMTCGGGLTPALPVDGGWSNWSGWSLCVGSSQSRTRTCTNPAPANGGANCTGSATESRFCSTGPICPMQPYIPSGHYLSTCQCPGDACPSYSIVPNGQFALCPHCP